MGRAYAGRTHQAAGTGVLTPILRVRIRPTDGTARGEPSLLGLSRVTEVDEVNIGTLVTAGAAICPAHGRLLAPYKAGGPMKYGLLTERLICVT